MGKKLLRIFIALAVAAAVAVGGLFVLSRTSSKFERVMGVLRYNVRLYDLLKQTHRELSDTVSEAAGPASPDYGWVRENGPFIAHAMGGLGELSYTNSREAFLHNYALGQRIFEVDFELTDGYALVCRHSTMADQREDVVVTMEQFLAEASEGGYTPLTAGDVIDLMAEYPDICVVTDTKYTDRTSVQLEFSELVRRAQRTNPEVLDRMIPQIYNERMYAWIMNVYPFSSVIYTLYNANTLPELAVQFCEATGVGAITIPERQATEKNLSLYKEAGILVGVHTINDPERAQAYLDMGADLIYTDFLTASDLAPGDG